MEFGFTPDQEALRKSAREVLAERAGPRAFRAVMGSKQGFDETLWKTIGDLGWMGLAVAEEDGGLGLGMIELAILFEEAGRGILPAPLLSTVGLAAAVAQQAPPSEARREFLSGVARGDTVATLAFTESEGRWDAAGVRAKAVRTESGWRLSGRKAFVPDAHVAREIVVAARTARSRDPREGVSLFLVPREALRSRPRPQPSLDGTRRMCELSLSGVDVPAGRLLSPEGEGWPILERGLERAAVAISAEAVGVCSKVLEMSVGYAKEREQFGRPIGSFQAVSHRIADQLVATESARSTLYYAAWALEESAPDASLAVATAKVAAGEAAHEVTNSAIQVHGGIGFTWEHDLHLYYRRGKWDEMFLGDAPAWRERIASILAES